MLIFYKSKEEKVAEVEHHAWVNLQLGLPLTKLETIAAQLHGWIK